MIARYAIADMLVATALIGSCVGSIIFAWELAGRSSYYLAITMAAFGFSLAGAAIGMLMSNVWRGAMCGLILFVMVALTWYFLLPKIQH